MSADRNPGAAVGARTARTFGYEWRRFHEIKPEDRMVFERWFADVPWGELGDALVLDAGCGRGQFTLFSAALVRRVVAFDFSEAVVQARRHLAVVPNASVVRADLLAPPFVEAAFDLVFSVGVLHHLADPAAGFRSLLRLVRPGGRILVYVYAPGGMGLRAADVARRVTTRLPPPVLRALSAPIAAGLYAGVVLPGRWFPRLPLEMFRGVPFRSLWHATFDRLAAPIEHRPTEPELRRWADGLEIEALRPEAGWILLARRPACAEGPPP